MELYNPYEWLRIDVLLGLWGPCRTPITSWKQPVTGAPDLSAQRQRLRNLFRRGHQRRVGYPTGCQITEGGRFFFWWGGAGGQWGTKIDVPTQKTNMASRKIQYLKMYFQLRSHLHLKVCTSPRGTCRWARSQSDMPALKMGMSIAIFFRVYNPYLGGLKPSFFMVFGV